MISKKLSLELKILTDIEIRDWSLFTGRGGGATKQEGWVACEVLPL